MATADEPRSKSVRSKRRGSRTRGDGIYRFTTDQFHQLDGLGFFDQRRVELIRGLVYEMTTNPGHATSSGLTLPILLAIFGQGWAIRQGMPLDLGLKTLTEPDFAVVAGQVRDYTRNHPTTAALIVEISETTLGKDRTLKAHIYAQAGLPDYWIVNLVDRQLEVHRSPGPVVGHRGRFAYRSVTIVPEAGNMAPLAAPGSPVAVAGLLP